MTLPSTISMRRVPLGITVPTAPRAEGSGSVVVGRSRLQARQFSLSGSIYYPDRQQIRDAADNLLQFLQHPPIEVYRWPYPDPRRLYAWPMGAAQDWMDAGAELGLDIPMLAPDPYWYGDEETSARPESGLWTVDVAGTAPTYPVVEIEVSASGGALTVAHTGTGLAIGVAGNHQPGDIVTVDTAAFTAYRQRGGLETSIVGALSDGFLAAGFSLWPGENGLDYSGPEATVTLTYRSRWI